MKIKSAVVNAGTCGPPGQWNLTWKQWSFKILPIFSRGYGILTNAMANTFPLGCPSSFSSLWLGVGADVQTEKWWCLRDVLPLTFWVGEMAERSNKIGLCLNPLSLLTSIQKQFTCICLTYRIFGQDFIWRAEVDSWKTFDNFWFRFLPVLTLWCSKIRYLASDMEASTHSAPLDSRSDKCCPMRGETRRPEWNGSRSEHTVTF